MNSPGYFRANVTYAMPIASSRACAESCCDGRLAQRRTEPAKADRGEFAEQPGHVAEMMRRRSVRDARLARGGAQRQPLHAVALEHGFGGFQQGVVQIAVMIGLLTRNSLFCRRFRRSLRGFSKRFHGLLILRHFYTVKISLDRLPEADISIFTM